MQRLADFDFEWVLPGHGRRLHASQDEMKQQMQKCISWMHAR